MLEPVHQTVSNVNSASLATCKRVSLCVGTPAPVTPVLEHGKVAVMEYTYLLSRVLHVLCMCSCMTCLNLVIPLVHTGTCAAAGYTGGCCTSGTCRGSPPTCSCDSTCVVFQD